MNNDTGKMIRILFSHFILFIFYLKQINSIELCDLPRSSTKYSNLISIEYTFKFDKFNDYGYLNDKLELNAILAIVHINMPIVNEIQLSGSPRNNSNDLLNLVKLLNSVYLIKLNKNNISSSVSASDSFISNYLNVIVEDTNITLIKSINLKFKFIKKDQLKIYFQNFNIYYVNATNNLLTINDNYIHVTKINVLISSNLLPFSRNNTRDYVIDEYKLIKLKIVSTSINENIKFKLSNNHNLYVKFSKNNSIQHKKCYNLTINAYDESKILENSTLELKICFNLASNYSKLVNIDEISHVYIDENTFSNSTHLLVYSSNLLENDYKYSIIDFKSTNITDLKFFMLNSTSGLLWLNKELVIKNKNCFHQIKLLAGNHDGYLVITMKIFCNFTIPLNMPPSSVLLYNYEPIFTRPFINNSLIQFQINYDSDLMGSYEFLLTEIDYISIDFVSVKLEMFKLKNSDTDFVTFNMNSSKRINVNFKKPFLTQYESLNWKLIDKKFTIMVILWNQQQQIDLVSLCIDVEIRILFLKNVLQFNHLDVIQPNMNEIAFGRHNVDLINYLVENFKFTKCLLNYIKIDNFNFNFLLNLNASSNSITLFNIYNSYYLNQSYNEIKLNCSLISHSKNINLALNIRIIETNVFDDDNKKTELFRDYSYNQIQYFNINNSDDFQIDLKRHATKMTLLYFISNNNDKYIFDYLKINHINGIIKTLKPFSYDVYFKYNNKSIIFVNIDVYLVSNSTLNIAMTRPIGLIFEDFIIKNSLEICASKYNSKGINVKSISSNFYTLDTFECESVKFELGFIKSIYNSTTKHNNSKIVFQNQSLMYQSLVNSNLIEIYEAKFIIYSTINHQISTDFQIFYKIQNTNVINFTMNEVNITFNSSRLVVYSIILNIDDYLTVKSRDFNELFDFQVMNRDFYLNLIDGNLYNLFELNEKYYSLKIVLNQKYSLHVNISLNSVKQNNDIYKVENVDQLVYVNSNRYINIIPLNSINFKPICLNVEQISCNNLFQINRNFLQIDKKFYTDKISNLNLQIDNEKLFISVDFTDIDGNKFSANLFNRTIQSTENNFKLVFTKNRVKNRIISIYVSSIINLQTNSEVLGLSFDFIKIKENDLQCVYNLTIPDIFQFETNQIYAFNFKINSTVDDFAFDTFYIFRSNETIKQIEIQEFLQFYENDIQNGQVVLDLDQIILKSSTFGLLDYESNKDEYLFLIDKITNDDHLNLKEYFTIGETSSDSSLLYLNNKKTLNLDRELFGSILKFLIKKFYVSKLTSKIYQVITFEVSFTLIDFNKC